MKYKEKPTQENRILQLLRKSGENGVPVWKLITPSPVGLGIAQYNARIYGLRQKGHVIENVGSGNKTRFVLRFDADGDVAKSGQWLMV
jgi:hypothetical protein